MGTAYGDAEKAARKILGDKAELPPRSKGIDKAVEATEKKGIYIRV